MLGLVRLTTGVWFGRAEKRRVVGALTLCRTAYAPDVRLPAHAHESAYLCLALAGGFRERSGAREEDVVPGAAVLHLTGERHADHFGPAPSLCLNVAFPPHASALDGAWTRDRERARYAAPATAGALVQRAARELEEDDDASALALEGLALELLALFARDARRDARRAPPPWLARAFERLRADPPVSLAELARDAGTHPATLVRAFRRFHDASPGELRRRWRVQRACAALRESDAPLAEIAARCGFTDQSHLSRALRRFVGLTPAAYRRAARGR